MSTWSLIDMVYILGHPKYESERLKRVFKQLHERGLPDSKIHISAPTWGRELSSKECFDVYDPWLKRDYPCFVFKSRALSKGEISLNLNFHNAVKHALANDYKHVIVFESDVLLRSDFNERLESIMTMLTSNSLTWDYVSLSDGVGTHAKDVQFGEWFSPQTIRSPGSPFPFRCTDSMLFHRNFLEKVGKTLIPFRDCLDWELNYQLYHHKGVALWAEPHIIEQGSLKRVDTSLMITE
jgi:hypothetical protein